MTVLLAFFFFFFQAEDGIRVRTVTGVQTCALPIWTPAKLVKTATFRRGAWAMAFLDRADVANALGYHDLTPDGLPFSKVFVKTTLAAGQKVSVTACHELAEMLVDPAINLCSTGPNNLVYAYETADAVEEAEFAINGIAMSDFVRSEERRVGKECRQ